MIINPNAIIDVRFKLTSEGGRKTSLIGEFYACPLFVDGKGFDCRIFLHEEVQLGKRYQLSLKFLNPSSAISKLSKGKCFTLWEGRDVADGQIIELFGGAESS